MSAATSLHPGDVWAEAQADTFRVCSRVLTARARQVTNAAVREELEAMAALFERHSIKGKR